MDMYEFIYASLVLASGVYIIKQFRDIVVALYHNGQPIKKERL